MTPPITEAMRQRAWCKHFNGTDHITCKVGMRYDFFVVPGQPPRWPCFGDPPRPTNCELYELPTIAELQSEEDAVAARLKEIAALVTNHQCIHCQQAVTRYVQVGRCVYLEPCGHRLWQGQMTPEMNRHNALRDGPSAEPPPDDLAGWSDD